MGDPQFELALLAGIGRSRGSTVAKQEIKSSRSLFAAKLPRLAEQGIPAGVSGTRQGYVKGPDDRHCAWSSALSIAATKALYLVQVAATTEDLDKQMARFEFDLFVTFALLGLALVGSSALQLRFGLRPLRRLQEGVAAIRRGEARDDSRARFRRTLRRLRARSIS